MRTRLGRDTRSTCASCSQPVWTSEVTRWTTAARLYWFLTGLCRKCQEEDR